MSLLKNSSEMPLMAGFTGRIEEIEAPQFFRARVRLDEDDVVTPLFPIILMGGANTTNHGDAVPISSALRVGDWVFVLVSQDMRFGVILGGYNPANQPISVNLFDNGDFGFKRGNTVMRVGVGGFDAYIGNKLIRVRNNEVFLSTSTQSWIKLSDLGDIEIRTNNRKVEVLRAASNTKVAIDNTGRVEVKVGTDSLKSLLSDMNTFLFTHAHLAGGSGTPIQAAPLDIVTITARINAMMA